MSIKKYTSIFLMIVLCATVTLCTSCANNRENSNISETMREEQTDDGNPFTFSTVSELKNAIKKNPKYYNNKEITIQGTICDRDSGLLLVDFNGSSIGVKEYAEIRKNSSRYIAIVIPDDVLSAVLETGDYIKLNGTVRISEGEIYLDNCEYTMITTRDER